MTYKRILIAVDGSKTSLIAFKEAVSLAKIHHAKICILHVIEKLPDHVAFAIDVSKYQILANQDAEKLLKKHLQIAAKQKLSADAKLIEIENYKESVSKKILQYAKSWKANLLVLGTHGRTGFSRLILGSVAEEILKTTTLPILVISNKSKEK